MIWSKRKSALHLFVLTFFITGVIAALRTADAQSQSSDPQFEAVSIKAVTSSNPFGMQPIRVEGGRFVANETTVSALVYWSYRSSDGKAFLGSQIVGYPSWATTDRFAVQAKVEGESRSVPLEEMQAMLRRTLQDRFQLKVHRETRQEQIYLLTVARPGRIKLSADQSAPPPSTGPRGFDPNKPPARGTSLNYSTMVAGSPLAAMVGTAVPITTLVSMLQGQLQRLVVNKTPLDGLYDFSVKYTPADALSTAPAAAPEALSTSQQMPSLFTALQEELGLKLESAKGPVEVLVIDHVERPEPN